MRLWNRSGCVLWLLRQSINVIKRQQREHKTETNITLIAYERFQYDKTCSCIPCWSTDTMNHSARKCRSNQTEHDFRKEFCLESRTEYDRFHVRNSLRNLDGFVIVWRQDFWTETFIPSTLGRTAKIRENHLRLCWFEWLQRMVGTFAWLRKVVPKIWTIMPTIFHWMLL